MKRILSAIGLSSILMLTLSGCMSINSSLVINPDGKTANAEFEVSYDREKMSGMAMTLGDDASKEKMSCDEISEMMKEGDDSVLPKENNSTKWTETDTHCIMKTSEVISYDESGKVTSDKMDKESSSAEGFKITKDGNKVFVEFDFGSENMNMSEAKMFIDEFNLSVTYPNEVLSANNNGVISKDGKTVTWDMLKANDGVFKALGTLPSLNNIYIISGIGIVVLIGTGLAFMTIRAKKKKTQAGNLETNTDSVEDSPTLTNE